MNAGPASLIGSTARLPSVHESLEIRTYLDTIQRLGAVDQVANDEACEGMFSAGAIPRESGLVVEEMLLIEPAKRLLLGCIASLSPRRWFAGLRCTRAP